jgi:thiosulfate/3-mercaptopyruvate sulfurtransferase
MKNFKDRDFLIENPDLFVIDVRYNMNDAEYGKKAYEVSHYKGAHFLDMDRDLASKVGIHGGRHPLPDTKNFEEKLRSIGLKNNTPVLVYDDGDNSAAGRLWWMLKYYGVEHVYVLEGGFATLRPEDLSKELPHTVPGDIRLIENHKMVASYEEIKEYADQGPAPSKIVVDSRSLERYLGHVEPVDTKKGHIPHAVNIFFRSHFNEDNTLNMDKLNENFKPILEKEDIIFHCGSGVTACTNVMALDELGIASRLYIGSFSDYISYEDNKVEREV